MFVKHCREKTFISKRRISLEPDAQDSSKMSNPLSAAVGRITAAVATVHNENSLSLANINFDFILVKLPPPKEYDGLGNSISRRRKLDAGNELESR